MSRKIMTMHRAYKKAITEVEGYEQRIGMRGKWRMKEAKEEK